MSLVELRQFCNKYGDVADAKLYTHPKSDRSIGMARVSFKRSSCARACAEQMHAHTLPGHPSNALTAFVDGVFNMCRQKIFDVAVGSMEDPRRPPNWTILFKRLRLEDLLPADLVDPECEQKLPVSSTAQVNSGAAAVLQSSPPFELHDLKAEPTTHPQVAPSAVPEARALLATPNSFSPRSDIHGFDSKTPALYHLPATTTESSGTPTLKCEPKCEPLASASQVVNSSSLSSTQCNSLKSFASEYMSSASSSSTPLSFLSSTTSTLPISLTVPPPSLPLLGIPLPATTSSAASNCSTTNAQSQSTRALVPAPAPVPAPPAIAPPPPPPPPPSAPPPPAPLPPPPAPPQLPLLSSADGYVAIGASPLLTGHYGLPRPHLPPLPFLFRPGFVPTFVLPPPPPPPPILASLNSSSAASTATTAAAASSATCSTSNAAARTTQQTTLTMPSAVTSTKTPSNGS